MRTKIFILLLLGILLAGSMGVSSQETTVCCQETNTGAFCQDVPLDQCAPGSPNLPTSCDSTSFCRAGTCYDSTEGTCLDNTPQLVCNDNGGVWSLESPPQCGLGCCILGDQAAFVTLVRCKRLSAFLGLETNYDNSISSELQCIAVTQAQDRGACVYDFEFQKSCQFTTRAECEDGVQTEGEGSISGEFHKDKLCSAEELGTICGPTTDTICVPGKDEVYFIDTCGNPANIYDATMIENQDYWANVKSKSESCGAGSGNILSDDCGNCNYLQGSFCRDEDSAGESPAYGDYICADLNCYSTSNGQSYKHGESWCVNNDAGSTGDGENSVGSRFYKHICINGEEVLEQCGDLRSQICIEDDIEGFSQAACRANRWQPCTTRDNRQDCENTDKMDCRWLGGVKFGVGEDGKERIGACLPTDSPGFNFWSNEETQEICAQADINCVVKYEKKIIGDDYQCVENCECLEDSWAQARGDICSALGDCGSSVNWIGEKGYKDGYELIIGGLEDPEETE